MPAKPRKVADQAVSASDSVTEDAKDAGNAVILSAISSLRCEIRSIKSDIEEIIDSKIEQLAVSIHSNMRPALRFRLLKSRWMSMLQNLQAWKLTLPLLRIQ